MNRNAPLHRQREHRLRFFLIFTFDVSGRHFHRNHLRSPNITLPAFGGRKSHQKVHTETGAAPLHRTSLQESENRTASLWGENRTASLRGFFFFVSGSRNCLYVFNAFAHLIHDAPCRSLVRPTHRGQRKNGTSQWTFQCGSPAPPQTPWVRQI